MDKTDNIINIAIIGGGPAGVTAAVYAARAGFAPVVFEKTYIGGQTANTDRIENYPALPDISGFDLAQNFSSHLSRFDVKTVLSEVKSVNKNGSAFRISTSKGEYTANAVILTTGSSPKKLGIKGENLSGVSYCATCDGNFHRGKTVAVIGGGNTAVSDVIFLSNICEKVYIIHRRDEFRADTLSVSKMLSLPNVSPCLSSTPIEITGNDKVTGLIAQTPNEIREIPLSGVFIAIGTVPATAFIEGVQKDESGAVITDTHMRTNTNGLFAAGDARNTPLKQIVTACADGAIAALSAVSYLR